MCYMTVYYSGVIFKGGLILIGLLVIHFQYKIRDPVGRVIWGISYSNVLLCHAVYGHSHLWSSVLVFHCGKLGYILTGVYKICAMSLFSKSKDHVFESKCWRLEGYFLRWGWFLEISDFWNGAPSTFGFSSFILGSSLRPTQWIGS